MSNNSKASFSSEGYFLEEKWMWGWAADTCQDTPIHRDTALHPARERVDIAGALGSEPFLAPACLWWVSGSACQGQSRNWERTPQSRGGQRMLLHTSALILIPIQCGHHCQHSALQFPGGPHWTGLAAASVQLPALLGVICTPAGGLAADPQPPRSPQGPCSSSGLS